MEIPKYSDWKESDMSWLGDIPSHWEVKSLRFIGNPIIGLTYSPDEICNDNEGVLVLRSTNIQGGKIIDKENVYVSTKINDKLTTKLNDILICSRNGSRQLIGKCGRIGKDFVGVSFGAFTTVFRSSANDFIYYVLSSQLFEYQSGLFLTTTINQLTVGAFNSFKVPLPPREEQIQIAKFLDYKTTQIDRLIEKKKALIEKLNEKRTALITQAVTKGLNPDAPMKDSEVDWLGKVPEHWEVQRLKFCSSYNDDSLSDTTEPGFELNYVDISSVSHAEGITHIDTMTFEKAPSRARRIAKSGDVIISTVRTYLKAIASIRKEIEGLIVSTGFAVIRAKKGTIISRFLSYFALSQGFIDTVVACSKGVSYPAINASELVDIFIAFPNHKYEQTQIAIFLDEKTTQIDQLVNKTSEAIDTLNEYRTALITAAVTGKIDVRNVSIPEQLASL